MHEVLVNRLGGLSLPRKSVVMLTDRPDMTLDVYCGRKTTKQQTTTTIHGSKKEKKKEEKKIYIYIYMSNVNLTWQLQYFSSKNEFNKT